MKSPWKWFWLSFLGGGIAFWIPGLIVPALNRNEQGGAVTVACPAVLVLFYAAVLRFRKTEHSGPSTAIFAICGMWILGLLFVMLAQEIRAPGGGGLSWGQLGYLVVSSFLPTRIFELVALEGSIFALLIGTISMVACHLLYERTRWIIPPRLRAAFHRSKTGGEDVEG
jgi:hypothetical protein